MLLEQELVAEAHRGKRPTSVRPAADAAERRSAALEGPPLPPVPSLGQRKSSELGKLIHSERDILLHGNVAPSLVTLVGFVSTPCICKVVSPTFTLLHSLV